MRIVVDTNVLLSAALRDRLPEAVVRRILASEVHQWIVSPVLLDEYQNVLGRPRFRLRDETIVEWMKAIRGQAHIVELNVSPAVRWIVEIKGQERPEDLKKLAAAERWVQAVNRDGRYGPWEYRYLRHPADLAKALSERTSTVAEFELDADSSDYRAFRNP